MSTRIKALGIVMSGLGLIAAACGPAESLDDEFSEEAVEAAEDELKLNALLTCIADEDCRAQPSTCDECACIAQLHDQRTPQCTGVIVRCLVDPCRDQRAICAGGQCVLGGDAEM
jgi:hypothetical protein